MMKKNTNESTIIKSAKKTLLLLAAITIITTLFSNTANASILGSTTTDKTVLGENEVALFTVKLMNDSENEERNVYLHIKADEGITFFDGPEEKDYFIKTIDSIKQNEVKEIRLKIKLNSVKGKTTNIYAYFGKETDLRQASVTVIETKPATAEIKTSYKISAQNAKDIITVDFTLKNNSKKSIYNASAEIITPQGFEILTPPLFEDKISPEGIIQEKFIASIPISAEGEQTVIIAYGYFDLNTPHYFEKTITFNVQKANYPIIALVAVIVIIIAGYLLLRKGNSPQENKHGVKGTGEK